VTERVARDWRGQVAKLAARPVPASIFLSNGAAPAAGTVHRQPKLAQALRAIAEKGAAAYYQELGSPKTLSAACAHWWGCTRSMTSLRLSRST